MQNKYKKIGFALLLISYSLLFFLIFTKQLKLDFSSLYAASQALLQGENPYQNHVVSYYLGINKILPTNLNPPFALWLFHPLAYFEFSTALLLWSFFCSILGYLGALIAFYYAVSPAFLRKNFLILSLFYCSFFATVMNTAILQLGGILLFFIMAGYYFYQNQRHYLAAIFWGIIIAMKLFPALLFCYVLKQRRFKVFGAMMIILFIALLIPVLVYGIEIYTIYATALSHALWYGDSWNASICGLVFRLFNEQTLSQNLIMIKLLYAFLFFVFFLWYLQKLGPTQNTPINHQPFCLTLVMMLFLSPLGWMYYFSLLIFPLVLTGITLLKKKKISRTISILWLLALFMINFPMDYVKTYNMTHFLSRISFFSIHFYGLSLLMFLVAQRKYLIGNNDIPLEQQKQYLIPVLAILLFGFSLPTISFITHTFFHEEQILGQMPQRRQVKVINIVYPRAVRAEEAL